MVQNRKNSRKKEYNKAAPLDERKEIKTAMDYYRYMILHLKAKGLENSKEYICCVNSLIARQKRYAELSC